MFKPGISTGITPSEVVLKVVLVFSTIATAILYSGVSFSFGFASADRDWETSQKF